MTRITALLGLFVLTLFSACAATDLGGWQDDAGGGKGDNPREPSDTCGNGLDDNDDGNIDEGCGCTRGATQACWPGEPGQRRVGACKDGRQTCGTDDGEFTSWGPCVGAVLPSPDTTNDGIDQDCNGEGGTPRCTPTTEQCTGGKDEDCDGKVDCADTDCASNQACAPKCTPTTEQCTGAKDEDCDGKVDCADTDCASNQACAPACQPVAESCTNGKDDDCDGKVDCDDTNCSANAACTTCEPFPHWEVCGDGEDNECDGKTDCEDDECWGDKSCSCTETCTPGATRWCDEELYCAWGKQTCGPDHRWGTCKEVSTRPSGCGGEYFYDVDCCVDAGACCQAMHLLTPLDYSVGTCAPVTVTCSET